MRADWDNPFGRISATTFFSNLGLPARKTPTGLYVTAPQEIDPDRIRSDQQKLIPYFEDIYAPANEWLESRDPFDRKVAAFNVFFCATYRLPDSPDVLTDFSLKITDHAVMLEETGERLHPLVEKLFPVIPVSTLAPKEQRELRMARQMEQCCNEAHVHMPEYIRTVFPATVHQIIDWIQHNEGPLKDFIYRPGRPTENNLQTATEIHLRKN